MGGLAAEKLFLPVTRRMEKIPKVEGVFPDYFKNVLPFGEGDEYEYEEKQGVPDYSLPPDDFPPDDFPPDDFPISDPFPSLSSIPSPSSLSPLPSPPSSPPPAQSLSPPSASPLSSQPSSQKHQRDSDTYDLITLKRFLNANQRKPNAVISTPKSKFFNWDKKMAEDRIEEIYQKRRKKVGHDMEKRIPGGYFFGLSKKERQKYLGFEDKSAKEVHKMKDFKNFSESEIKNMFGMGLSSLITRLSLGISSINAGNTSIKLKKEVASIADILFQQKIISKAQRSKILSLK